ncbi:MAG: hypothetical protein WAU70_03575 [Flavobacteriales bacterium]
MNRSTFMLAMAWFHLVAGAFFLFSTQRATEFIFCFPEPTHRLLMVGLGAVVSVFGLMNYLARNSEDSQALRALLLGTTFYLFFTVAFDVYWTLHGSIKPIAWISIALRTAFASMYIHFITRMRIRER